MLHHGFKQGKKVYVKLKTKECIIDKFVTSTSKYLVLENYKIEWSKILCTSINKNRRSIE